jgi:hypothetical protein
MGIMSQQLYEINETDPPFIKELLTDINKNININKNAFLLILTRKLAEYKIGNYIKEEDLPYQAIVGTSYLIRNNSIFAFENMFIHESLNNIFSHSEPVYKSVMTVYNLDIKDVGGAQREEIFDGMTEEITYSTASVVRFMLMLMNNFGFKIYMKNPMPDEEFEKITTAYKKETGEDWLEH